MGWEIDRFLVKESIEDYLICSICTDVVKEPIQTPQCDHIFCRECIMQWLGGGNRTCPVDRQLVTSDSLKALNRMAKQSLNKLVIRCKNYGDGCRLMSKLEDMPQLNEHELNLCTVAQNNIIRETEERHRKEDNDLRIIISELEDSLSLEKGLHSITIEDKDKVIEQKQKRITDLEKKIDQTERKSTEIFKKYEEKAMPLADVARTSNFAAQRTSGLANLSIAANPSLNQTSTGKFNL